jgi:hypothetical protein
MEHATTWANATPTNKDVYANSGGPVVCALHDKTFANGKTVANMGRATTKPVDVFASKDLWVLGAN